MHIFCHLVSSNVPCPSAPDSAPHSMVVITPLHSSAIIPWPSIAHHDHGTHQLLHVLCNHTLQVSSKRQELRYFEGSQMLASPFNTLNNWMFQALLSFESVRGGLSPAKRKSSRRGAKNLRYSITWHKRVHDFSGND